MAVEAFFFIFEINPEMTWSEKGIPPSNYRHKGSERMAILTFLVRNLSLEKKKKMHVNAYRVHDMSASCAHGYVLR